MTIGQTVWLQRPSEDIPWGFRLAGGRDYKEPLKIQRVTAGTIASRELATGDLVMRIGHEDTGHLTQAQANELVKHCGNCLQLCISKSGGAQPAAAHTGPYTPYTPHTPVTPGTPGGGQVAAYQRRAGEVHDLFEDMYRQSDPNNPGHVTNNHVTPHGSHRGPSVDTYKTPQQTNPMFNVSNTNGGITKLNNEIIGPFYPNDKDNADAQNANIMPQNLRPNTSLSSSTDSGISYGQTSQKMGSPPCINHPASMSSSISELSESFNQNSSQLDDSLPSPPPPLTGSSSQNPFTSTGISSSSCPLPSPPPPLPSSEPPTWQPPTPSSAESIKEPPRTRLEQQLAELNVSGYMSPTNSYPAAATTGPTTPSSYHSPTAAPGAPGYHPLANVPPAPPVSGIGAAPVYNGSMGSTSPRGKPTPPPVADKPQMPDKVLNMAAKSGSDKKPFSYAPDVGSLAEQRDKVRRRPGAIPAYQNMLNLPDFNDPPVAPHLKKREPEKSEAEPALPAGPGEGVFRHAQYNSPLQLYSNDAVDEAFQGQTGGVVTSAKRSGQKAENDITQSETYKMIHGLDAPKKRPTVTIPSQPRPRPPRGPADDDEMTFSGVNRLPDEIPSRAFHKLQTMTGGAEIDTTSIRPRQDGEDGVVGGYDEASIRYMGRNIPSKSFRMLQNLTGGAQPVQPAGPHKRRPMHKANTDVTDGQLGKDDIASMSYVGGNIPSKSFRMLQQSIGEPEQSQQIETIAEQTEQPQPVPPSEIPGGPPTASPHLPGDRRQRRRQRNREIQHSTSFTEPPAQHTHLSHGPTPQSQHSVPADSAEQEGWDEQAYLQGKVAILSEEPKAITPKEKAGRERAPWERDDDEVHRRRQLLAEQARTQKEVVREVAPWEARRQDSYPDASGPPGTDYQHTEQHDVARPQPQRVEQQEEGEQEAERDFDEAAFLEGRVPLVSGDTSRADAPQATHYKKPKKYRERAPWEKPDSDDEQSGFAEGEYLAGKIALVGGKDGQSTGTPGGRFARIPSRTFNILRRSISRDGSPGSRSESLCSADYQSTGESERSEGEEPVRNLVYVGKNIPSKTFNKLRMSMDKRSQSRENLPTTGDFDRLRHETRELEEMTRQLDNVHIENKKPEEYLENLKESMQRDGVKIEEAEATDF